MMKRLGREEEFKRDLQHLRETYKRKRNFLKLLDEKIPRAERKLNRSCIAFLPPLPPFFWAFS